MNSVHSHLQRKKLNDAEKQSDELLLLHQLLSEGTDTLSSGHPGDSEEERGDGAEPRLILPLQPPDEHPPDHHPWELLSLTQQLAVPRFFLTYRIFPSKGKYQSVVDGR